MRSKQREEIIISVFFSWWKIITIKKDYAVKMYLILPFPKMEFGNEDFGFNQLLITFYTKSLSLHLIKSIRFVS